MKDFYHSFRKPVSFLLVLILIGGGYFYSKTKTSLFPEITFPKIKIIAEGQLQPEEQMMVTVTRPLEDAVKRVPGLKMIRSTTSRGSCEISAFMTWKTDIDVAQLQVESRINQVRNQLPAGLQITVEKMNPSILPVIGYSLESDRYSLISLKKLAVYTVKPYLSQVEGVAAVEVLGGKDKEFRVILDRQKMSSLGITPSYLQKVMSQNGIILSNGFFNDYNRLYLSITDASFHHKTDVENIVVRNDEKRIVLLKDISEIKIEKAVEYVKINANGKEGVLINIVKQPGANLITTTDSVQKKLAGLRNVLPPGVTISPYYVQAEFVNNSIHSVKDALWIGLALAIVVALLFLRSLKAGAALLIIIPITLALTIVVLYALNYTFNIMTLGALVASIGLIIDDAVVIVEQIHRTHEEHPQSSPRELVRKAIRYLFPAMVGSSLSTIVIFMPFVLMSGVAGAYFGIMTRTMIITLVVSFLVTWTGLPVVYLLLSGKRSAGKNETAKEAHGVKKQDWVGIFTHKPYISIAIVLALAGVIVLVYPRLETGFLPYMDEGSIVLDFNSPPGTSLEGTDQMLQEVDKILYHTPEVVAFSRRTGAQMGFFITEPNRGDYLIKINRKKGETTEEVIEEIRAQVDARVPGLTTDFGQVITDMLGDLTTSVQPVEIKIFGNDNNKLHTYAKKVAGIVRSVRGTADVFDGIVISGPSVDIVPDYKVMARYGLSPADIQNQLQLETEGLVAGRVIEGEYMPDIQLAFHDSTDFDMQQLLNTRLFLSNGDLIPLKRVADVRINRGSAEIDRENLQNMGVVSARLSGTDLGTAMRDIQKKINTQLSLPRGYYIEYGGDYKQQQQSFKELLTILIVASMLVFLVVLFLFRDFRASVIIIMIAILGISGGY
ncbi:MAG TPA: efflux RND transporter permease subunit, partial [Bacteroidales bacterium]|nr:efflux RND transporter permease subunit [Bacteroidales bacterium]